MIAALALGGCALTISGPASDRPRHQRPICDTSKGFVATDAILGSLMGTVALAALGAEAGEVALLPGAIGAGFILSAISGNGRANACRVAYTEYEAALRSRPSPDEDDTGAVRRAELRGPRAAVPPPVAPFDAAPGREPGPMSAMPPAAVAPPSATGRSPAPEAVPAPAGAPPAGAPTPGGPPAGAAPPPAAPARPPPRPAPPPPPISDRWIEFWKELP